MKPTQKEAEDGSRRINRRALLLGTAMTGMFGVLAARVRYLSVDQAEEFKLLAEENRINIRLIPPERGLIQDRNGRLIAGNEQNYRITITREDAGDVDLVLTRLSRILALSEGDLARIKRDIARNSSFVPIPVAERLSWDDFSRVAINAPALPGVQPEVGLSRRYPLVEDFAHVAGYVGPVSERDLKEIANPDPVLQIPKFQIGKIGVERWMEDTLRGSAGTKKIEVNAVGRVMRELERNDGTPGADIRLTIDADVQNFILARLAPESAACVVMDVTNGDLIAAVSAPSFDPNLFVRGIAQKDYSALMEHDHRPLSNKAVQGTYPPGSTFKLVTGLAAMEAGVMDPSTRVFCPGYLTFGNRDFHCWKHGGHGTVGLADALAQSCDVFFYTVALKVGIDRIADMGRRLGLGIRHDLPMSAISEGIMPDRDWKRARWKQEWRQGDTINASIGQGYVLASPLQLAVMAARIATGRSVVPRLIKSVGGKETDVAEAPPLDIPEPMLAAVRAGMHDVTNSQRGTAYASRIFDATMMFSGKTGTSQVRNISSAERADGVTANEDLPWPQRDHALFVGFAPYDKPRYSVAVVVEHGGGGSHVAAPLARDAILRALCGTIPPLTAYPPDQRARIETDLMNLQLRTPPSPPPAPSRA